MLCARGGQLVDPNATVCRRDAPFSFDKLFFEKALERWIQGAFFDLKQILRTSLDVLYEGIAVHRLSFQHTENHHFQGTRKKVSLCCFFHMNSFFSRPTGLSALGLEQNSMRALPKSSQIVTSRVVNRRNERLGTDTTFQVNRRQLFPNPISEG